MVLPRTSPDSVLFASYNLLDLFETDTEQELDRYRQVREVIAGLGADVLAVQEIRAPQAGTARVRLRQLAADVGMQCVVPGLGDEPELGDEPGLGDEPVLADGRGPVDGLGHTALAAGPRGYHCGLLWRPGIEPVPGSFHESPAGRMWHGAGWLTLDVGGVRIRHGTFHASPFGRRLRADQNELLLAMLRSGPDRAVPLLIGADWNTESADRIVDETTGDLVLYEPADPFADVTWFEGLIHQCQWDYDWRGRRRHWADRRAGDVLFAGGLLDAAAVLRAPWQPTVGYYPEDGYAARGIMRRIDAVRVTSQVVPALRAYHVTDTPLARSASDHLPVSVEYVPAQIAAQL